MGRVAQLLVHGAVLVCLLFGGPLKRARAVGGISGAKIVAPNTETVPKTRIEVEPYFTYSFFNKDFDRRWKSIDGASELTSAVLGLRCTAGLADTVEAGLMLPIVFERSFTPPDEHVSGMGLGDVPVGLKWRFLTIKRVSLAAQTGVTLPTGNSNPGPSELSTGEGKTVLEAGLILTIAPIQNLSIDLSVAGGLGISVEDRALTAGMATDLAVGYQFRRIQPVVELNYVFAFDHRQDAHKLALTTGLTFNLSVRVIIVAGIQIDIAGRRESKGLTCSLAFTILL